MEGRDVGTIGLLQQQEIRCMSTDTPLHTPYPGQQGVCRAGSRSRGQEQLLNQWDAPQLLTQSQRGACWGSHCSEDPLAHTGPRALARISSPSPSQMPAPIICLHCPDISFLWPQSREEAAAGTHERGLFPVATQQP